jgi:hypothetical protein
MLSHQNATHCDVLCSGKNDILAFKISYPKKNDDATGFNKSYAHNYIWRVGVMYA